MLNPPKKQFNQRFWWLMPGASEDFFWWRFSQTTVWRWWNQPTKMFAPIGNAPLLAGTPWESKPTNRCVNTEAGGSMAEVEKVHIADRILVGSWILCLTIGIPDIRLTLKTQMRGIWCHQFLKQPCYSYYMVTLLEKTGGMSDPPIVKVSGCFGGRRTMKICGDSIFLLDGQDRHYVGNNSSSNVILLLVEIIDVDIDHTTG